MRSRSSRRASGTALSRARPGPRRWLPFGLAVVVAALLMGGLFWLNRGGAEPGDAARVAAAKIEGDPNAPVEVEEWGDFQ